MHLVRLAIQHKLHSAAWNVPGLPDLLGTSCSGAYLQKKLQAFEQAAHTAYVACVDGKTWHLRPRDTSSEMGQLLHEWLLSKAKAANVQVKHLSPWPAAAEPDAGSRSAPTGIPPAAATLPWTDEQLLLETAAPACSANVHEDAAVPRADHVSTLLDSGGYWHSDNKPLSMLQQYSDESSDSEQASAATPVAEASKPTAAKNKQRKSAVKPAWTDEDSLLLAQLMRKHFKCRGDKWTVIITEMKWRGVLDWWEPDLSKQWGKLLASAKQSWLLEQTAVKEHGKMQKIWRMRSLPENASALDKEMHAFLRDKADSEKAQVQLIDGAGADHDAHEQLKAEPTIAAQHEELVAADPLKEESPTAVAAVGAMPDIPPYGTVSRMSASSTCSTLEDQQQRSGSASLRVECSVCTADSQREEHADLTQSTTEEFNSSESGRRKCNVMYSTKSKRQRKVEDVLAKQQMEVLCNASAHQLELARLQMERAKQDTLRLQIRLLGMQQAAGPQRQQPV